MTAHELPIYEIRVKGRLGSGWGAWFGGLDISSGSDGTTVIRGPVVDQAALHGLLQQLRDVGLVLESLSLVGPGEGAGGLPSHHNNPTGATS